MPETNGKVSQKAFYSILGIFVLLTLTALGYASSRISANEQQTQDNEVMIGRFEEKFISIDNSLKDIKTILSKSSFIIDKED